MLSRDIRLAAHQIIVARDACAKDRRELERRLERTSYEGKPGMKSGVVERVKELRELERVLEHNRVMIARDFAESMADRG